MYQVQLIAHEDINSIIPLLQLLDNTQQEDKLKQRLAEMLQHGYQCVGVYDAGTLIAISGIWILYKYYVGKHLEPDNVVVLPEYRGKAIGELMMKWIYDYAISIGCQGTELNCYVNNPGGVKFWHNQGYKIVGFHFQKKFTSD